MFVRKFWAEQTTRLHEWREVAWNKISRGKLGKNQKLYWIKWESNKWGKDVERKQGDEETQSRAKGHCHGCCSVYRRVSSNKEWMALRFACADRVLSCWAPSPIDSAPLPLHPHLLFCPCSHKTAENNPRTGQEMRPPLCFSRELLADIALFKLKG